MIERSAAQAYETARLQKRNVKMVRYEHLAKVAHSPQWFYLAEVIPTAMPLSAALALRQQNEDVLAGPSAVTSAAPEKAFSGKRVVKSKSRKNLDPSNVDGLATARTTTGKKMKLPAGIDHKDEDFEEDQASEQDEAGEAECSEDGAETVSRGGASARPDESIVGASGATPRQERVNLNL